MLLREGGEEEGYASAQYNLGSCFANGEGVSLDWVEAARSIRLAADQSLAAAQYNLGVCFEHGDGVAQDLAEAVRYYRLAAAQGCALSLEQHARMTAAFSRIACSREVASKGCNYIGT
jgi:TPR repeat protein